MLRLLTILISLCFSLVLYASPEAYRLYAKQGMGALELGQKDEAMQHFDRVYAMYRTERKDTAYANTLRNIGVACYGAGRYSAALRFFRLGTKAAVDSHNVHTRIACTGNVGLVFATFGDNGTAVFYFEKAFRDAVEAQDTLLSYKFASNLVVAYCNINDTRKAEHYSIQRQRFAKNSSPSDVLMHLKDSFLIASGRKDNQRALSIAQRIYGLTQHHDMGAFFESVALSYMGDAYLQLGIADSAIFYIKKSIDCSTMGHLDDAAAQEMQQLANAYNILGDSISESIWRHRADAFADSVYQRDDFEAAKREYWDEQDRTYNESIDKLNNRVEQQLLVIVVVSIVLLIVAGLTIIIVRQNRRLKNINQNLYERSIEMLDDEATEDPSTDESASGTDVIEADSDKQSQLINNILHVMNDVSIISNPDFKMQTLVRMVGSNTLYVSNAINSGLKKNFKTLLNERRIAEACRRLRDPMQPANITMQALGELVGYTAESSFFTAFKKIVGMTPTEYQKMARQDMKRD